MIPKKGRRDRFTCLIIITLNQPNRPQNGILRQNRPFFPTSACRRSGLTYWNITIHVLKSEICAVCFLPLNGDYLLSPIPTFPLTLSLLRLPFDFAQGRRSGRVSHKGRGDVDCDRKVKIAGNYSAPLQHGHHNSPCPPLVSRGGTCRANLLSQFTENHDRSVPPLGLRGGQEGLR